MKSRNFSHYNWSMTINLKHQVFLGHQRPNRNLLLWLLPGHRHNLSVYPGPTIWKSLGCHSDYCNCNHRWVRFICLYFLNFTFYFRCMWVRFICLYFLNFTFYFRCMWVRFLCLWTLHFRFVAVSASSLPQHIQHSRFWDGPGEFLQLLQQLLLFWRLPSKVQEGRMLWIKV